MACFLDSTGMMTAASPLRLRARLKTPTELTTDRGSSQPVFDDKQARSGSKESVVNLMQSRCFRGRSPGFVRQLVTRLCLRNYLEGQDIVTQGSPAYTTFFMISGRAEMVVGDEDRPVVELPEGSIFGDMAIHGESNALATVRALEKCECRVIDYRHFRPLLKSFPAEEQFFKSLARERMLHLELAQRGLHEVRERSAIHRSSGTHNSLGFMSRGGTKTTNVSCYLRRHSKTRRKTTLLTHNETLLGSVDFFSGCHPEFLKHLAPCLELKSFTNGDIILKEGDEGYLMYLLKSGSVEVLRGTGNDEVLLDIMEAGSFFGEMALFGMPTRSATVRAVDVCQCAVVNFHDFQKVLRSFPDERVYFGNLARERQRNQAALELRNRGAESSHNRLDEYNPRLFELRVRKPLAPLAKSTTRAGELTPVGFHLSNMGQTVLRARTLDREEDLYSAGNPNSGLTLRAQSARRRGDKAEESPRSFMLNKSLKGERFCLDGRPHTGDHIRSLRSQDSENVFDQAPASQRPASAGSVAPQSSEDAQDTMPVSKRHSLQSSIGDAHLNMTGRARNAAGATIRLRSLDSASFVDTWPSDRRSEFSD